MPPCCLYHPQIQVIHGDHFRCATKRSYSGEMPIQARRADVLLEAEIRVSSLPKDV